MTCDPEDEILEVLKDGYWERTCVVRKAGGSLCVRKESGGGDTGDRPWARTSLVREIRYMRDLPGDLADLFPQFLTGWGDAPASGAAGYEMDYMEGWEDLGQAIRSGNCDHNLAKLIEVEIAEGVIGRLHEECEPEEPLSGHVDEVFDLVCRRLALVPELAQVVNRDRIWINSNPVRGLQRSVEVIRRRGLLHGLDESPQVRLHGDLILENVIVPAGKVATSGRSFLLIDPVSVAGVTSGHPAFDLVKYESYAAGDLLAIRCGAMTGEIEPRGEGRYRLRLEAHAAALKNLKKANLGQGFRDQYNKRYGEPDPDILNLLDGYFSLAMAVNTTGQQPLTRALMAAKALAKIGGNEC